MAAASALSYYRTTQSLTGQELRLNFLFQVEFIMAGHAGSQRVAQAGPRVLLTVWRVSSARIASAKRRTRRARRVMSSRFPIGVLT